MTDERQPSAGQRRIVNVRSFIRGGYLSLEEPVTVIRGMEVLGFWYPAGTEDSDGAHRAAAAPPVAQAPVRAMTQAERDKVLRRMTKGGNG